MSEDNKLIRVLVADESEAVVERLRRIVNQEPDMLVIGSARSGREAVDRALTLKPDLITMDVGMLEIDGVLATRAIMASRPTPIAVVIDRRVGPCSDTTFQALSAGAVDVLEKPSTAALNERDDAANGFVQQLRNLARVGVVGFRTRRRKDGQASAPPPPPGPSDTPPRGLFTPRLVALGASTGGPPCLRAILRQLEPAKAPPILLVQHMSVNFVEGFVAWLDAHLDLEVELARDGAALEPGVVYVAPESRHLTVDAQLKLSLAATPPVHGHRPAVDPLFFSVAQHVGRGAVGVLLTGMGSDGALGLRALRNAGALTIAQDEASSLVYGMPKAAVDQGAAALIANPLHIGRILRRPQLLLGPGGIPVSGPGAAGSGEDEA